MAEPTALPITRRALPDRIRYFVRELTRRATTPGPNGDPDLELGGLAMALSMVADEAEQELAKAQQPPAPEPTTNLDITPWLVVHRYREHGKWLWCWRCWGDGECTGWLALDLDNRPYAERNARRHLAENHPEEPTP